MRAHPIWIRKRASQGKRPMPLRWRTEIGAIRYGFIAIGVATAGLCFGIPLLLMPFGIYWSLFTTDSSGVWFAAWGSGLIAFHFAEKRALARFEARLDRGERPCPACGFDAAGVGEDARGDWRCPECGIELLTPEEMTRYWRATLWHDRSRHRGTKAAEAYETQTKGPYLAFNLPVPERSGPGPVRHEGGGATGAGAGR